MKRWILLGLLLCLAANSSAEQEGTQPSVRKVVLYKHGLGYFEHKGTVSGDAEVDLTFKLDQMKDLLTSFYAIDLDGGKITNISYDSKEPISKELEDILIKIPEGNALTEFAKQLVGAKVRVKIGSQDITGRVLGIEPVAKQVETGTVTTYKLVLADEEGRIEAQELLELSSLQLLDEPLQKDLKRALDIYLRAKYKDRKTVRVYTKGKGDRTLQVGYLIETPVWKTSYRLLLHEKDKPLLQGWSIVENTTDYDWENVSLSLVAGNPISFILDLYTTFVPARQVVDIRSLFPSVKIEGLEEAPRPGANAYGIVRQEKETKALRALARRARPMAEAAVEEAPAPPREDLVASLGESVEAAAKGVQVGELFSYEVKTPVSVAKGKSALVPILSQPVEGEKVLYYKETMSRYPLNAFYLTNSSELTLDNGPVTFFEESTSLGEGLLKRILQPGMRELIPYAVETGVEVAKTIQSRHEPIHKITVADGILTARRFNLQEASYKILNKTRQQYSLYLDHPKTMGCELLAPEKPEEEFERYYRFKISVPTKKPVEFAVRERQETASTIVLQNANVTQLGMYLNEPALTKKTATFLQDITKLMAQIADLKRQYQNYDVEYKRLKEDQDRYRKNMTALRDTPGEREVRADYLKKLQETENRIGNLRANMLQNEDQVRKLETELSQKIRSFRDEE